MFGRNLVIALSIGAFITAGCNSGFNQDPEELIAACDFQAALPPIEERCRDDPKDSHWQRLKGMALLAEGREAEGWTTLQLDADDADGRRRAGETVLLAARYIIREQNRSEEAIRLLDSAIAWNDDLKQDALKLAWDRAIEYLGGGGDAGFWLMRFVIRQDPAAMGRMRAGYQQLTKRYDEWQAVERELTLLVNQVERYYETCGRYPVDLTELTPNSPVVPQPFRSGWTFKLDKLPGKPAIVAEALPRNPADIPIGSLMTVDIGRR